MNAAVADALAVTVPESWPKPVNVGLTLTRGLKATLADPEPLKAAVVLVAGMALALSCPVPVYGAVACPAWVASTATERDPDPENCGLTTG